MAQFDYFANPNPRSREWAPYIADQEYFLSTAELASVPLKELPPCRGNLSAHRDDLLAAVDLLFTAV